jgi:hypothetical protein
MARSTGNGWVGGGITVAVSQNTASNSTTVAAAITGSAIELRARNVSVRAINADQAFATGQANAGSSLIGGTGITSTATATPWTQAYIDFVKNFVATGDVTISANNTIDRAVADARGVNAPGLAVGVSNASATVTPKVQAFLANGAYTIGGSLVVQAAYGDVANLSNSNNQSAATATGSVGALPVTTVIQGTANPTISPTVVAVIGEPNSPSNPSNTTVSAGRNVSVMSKAASNGQAVADNGGNGFFYAKGGSTANVTINQYTQAWAGNNVKITADNELNIIANGWENATARANASAGGTIPDGDSNATIAINHSATVTVGANAQLKADQANLQASDSPTAQTNAANETKGFGGSAIATAENSVNNNDWAGGRRAVPQRIEGRRAHDCGRRYNHLRSGQ